MRRSGKLRRSLAIVSALSASLVGLLPASAAAPTEGSFDPSFGLGGGVIDWRNGGAAMDTAVQPDGKVLISSDVGWLYRFTAQGNADASFGTDGVVHPGNFTTAVAVQSDGKIVTLDLHNNGDAVLARWRSNGQPDTTFAGTGQRTIPVGTNGNVPQELAIQPDGKIVVVGAASNASWDSYVARFKPGGALDPTFNPLGATPGVAPFNFSNTDEGAEAVALQKDGKIVVAGMVSNGSNEDFSVFRVTPAGALDTTFGTFGTGLVKTAIGTGDDVASSVAIAPDGHIYAAGYATWANTDAVVARYTSAGALDTAWGEAGHRAFDELGLDSSGGVAVQRNGKVVLAGTTFTSGTSPTNLHVLLARLNRDGSDDTSFGTPRVYLVGNNPAGGNGGVVIMRDGRIVVGGDAEIESSLLPSVFRFIGDTHRPTAATVTIGAKTKAGRRPISWHATDDNTGVHTYAVQLRWHKRSATKFGSWHAFRTWTTARKAVFTPTSGRRYCFRARARDWAGNSGPYGASRCFNS